MPSWKEHLRSWLKSAPRRKAKPQLQVHQLEERANPVLGSFDTPFPVDFDTVVGSSNLTGVVNVDGVNTGSLIDRGATVVGSRHVLTSASANVQVGDVVSFYSRAANGSVKIIDVPVSSVWVHPAYNAGTFANDIAVLTLAAVAPEYSKDYPIYLGSFGTEIGKPYYIAGYGQTGTGTSGSAISDIQRLNVTATGGTYSLFSPSVNLTTAPIPFDATPAQVQAALVGIGLSVQVTSPQFGPNITVPNQFYSYEIAFQSPVSNARRLQYVPVLASPLVNGGNNGQVDVTTLTNGNFDGQFQRLTINGTAGTFRLGLSGNFTSPLPYNATDTQIQAALQTLPGVTEVTVRLIPAGSASGAGSFQISFDQPTGGFPVITVNTTAMTGTGSAYILQNQGRPALRLGTNEYDSGPGTFLASDFDTDGTDSFAALGDIGGPGFVDIGGGQLAIATVFSNGTGKFGAVQQGTRVSKYTTDISNIIDAKGYTATVDMNFQIGGNDGIADTFRVTENAGRIEVYVKDSKAGPERLFYADLAANMSSVVLRGSNDDDTFIIDSSVSVLVSIEGGGGKNTLVGPDLDTAWIINGTDQGTGDTALTDFNFKGIRAIVGGSKDDTFTFAAGGKLTGSIDGSAGADTIDFSSQAATLVTVSTMGVTDGAIGTIAGSNPLGGQFRNIDNIVGAKFGTADNLIGPPSGGTWTHNGIGGVYVDSASGKSFQYSNFEILTGGVGDDTFNIQSATAALTVNGGAGTNAASVDGTAGNEAVVMTYQNPAGDSKLTGLAQPISFTNVATINYDGKGGTNSYRFQDQSGISRGSPVEAASGIVYAPSGQFAGTVRVGTQGSFGVAGINDGLTVDGGGTGSTFLVLGTSGPGIQSGFGENVVGNGRDQITVTDTAISITSVTAGPLLGVLPAYSLGTISFSTIYVAGGNEPLNQGDVFTVTPSFNVNLVVDGQGPSSSARPGDRVELVTISSTTSAFVNDPAIGPPQNRITQVLDSASVGLVNIESGVPPSPGTGMIAVATDAGPLTTVQVYERLNGALRFQFVPFENFFLGASVGSGDFNGDGIADVIVGAGPGGGPRVAIFNGLDGTPMADFFAYEDTFRGGVNVSAADFNGDGRADLVIGTGVGGGPRVRVLSGADLSPIRDVFVYESTFRGGVNVSAGDFNNDGTPDLITSTGIGGGPRVVVLSGTNLQSIASFFVFDPNSRTGFYAAASDVNGDGYADVIAGAGAGEPARIRVISGLTRQAIGDFYVNDPLEPGTAIPSIQFDAGVRVAGADVNGDGISDVITAKGPGSLPTIRVYQLGGVDPITNALFPTLAEIMHFDAFGGGSAFGLFVGGSN